MTSVRIASGLVMLVVFLVVNFWLPSILFLLVMALLAAVGMWEWCRLSSVQNQVQQIALCVAAFVIALLLQVCAMTGCETLVRWVVLLGFLVWLGNVGLLYINPVRRPIANTSANTSGNRPANSLGGVPDLSLIVTGLVLLPIASLCMFVLHQAPTGSPWLLLYALGLVWAMDIGAYFTGRAIGKNKLAPLISPGKTIEGVGGGVALAALIFVLLVIFSGFNTMSTVSLLLATVCTSAISVVGDLYESRLKRSAGLKDSGNLIPGHGGVLDRIDGVIAAMPMFAFFVLWF